MRLKRLIQRHGRRTQILLIASFGLIIAFQNCSSEIRDSGRMLTSTVASSSQTTPSPNPLEGIVQAQYSTFQNTRLKANLFTLYPSKDPYSRFDVVTTTTHGQLQILDHRYGSFIYDPAQDFTGEDSFDYSETLPSGDVRTRTTKIFTVKSTMLGDLKPALAVRAMGCIGCHATIGSNIITDFGAGGDGVRDYSFGKMAIGASLSTNLATKIGLNEGNVYFDHNSYAGYHGDTESTTETNPGSGDLVTLNMAAGTQIYIPNGLAFPADLGSAMINRPDHGDQVSFVSIVNTLLGNPAGTPFSFTVQQYLQSLTPGLAAKKFPTFAVSGMKQVYIGAPTAARIAQIRADAQVIAEPTDPAFVYVKESAESPALANIEVKGDTIYAHDGFTCDGDLFVDRRMVIEDMTLITNLGCRIYSPQSVFIQGMIRYESNKPYANMQISSARAIFAGVGANTCNDANTTDTNSLYRRLHDWWTPSMFTRGDLPGNATQSGPEVTEDQLYKDASGLTLSDARCIEATLRAAGKLGATQEVAFDRVVWNAPKVHSRFRGNINGVIIAEIPFLAISNVKYNFSDTFTNVSVLPMLAPSDFLMLLYDN